MSGHRRRLVIRLGACVLISLVLAGVTALLASSDRLGRFEGIASDLGFPRGEADESVVVVGIDSEALAAVGAPWPWPRQVHAELVRALDEAGARVIVFDVAFVDEREGDVELADAIQDAGNVVLAATAASESGDEDEAEDRSEDGNEDASRRRPSQLTRVTLFQPTTTLADAAAAVAHAGVEFDPNDGAVREIPLVVEDQERAVVPALALTALAVAEGASPDPIVRRPSGVQVAGRGIPTDDRYLMRLSYAPELDGEDERGDPDDEAYVSAADVLDGTADEMVRDKVVFIGATDVSLGDRMPTPIAKSSGMPGVRVHANAYSTMATRNYLSLASQLEIAFAVFVVSLAITLVIQFLPALLAGLAAVGLLAVYLFVAFLRVDTGIIMNFTYPTIAVALAVPLSGGVRYFVETRQRRRVAALFSQYVPARVAEQLIDEGLVESAAEGARVEATAMFADLRGFTTLSSALEPAQVNAMLSDFYEYASRIVLEHGGTLMTYIGDEVFVIFGAPIVDDDHAGHAIACARELQENVGELDAALAVHGFEPLRFGIGLNAGEVVVSHAGSTWRRQYTAIGDTVNVAARLTSQAGPGQVVLSEAVRAGASPAPEVTSIGPLEMKGVRKDFEAWLLVLERPPSGTRDR